MVFNAALYLCYDGLAYSMYQLLRATRFQTGASTTRWFLLVLSKKDHQKISQAVFVALIFIGL